MADLDSVATCKRCSSTLLGLIDVTVVYMKESKLESRGTASQGMVQMNGPFDDMAILCGHLASDSVRGKLEAYHLIFFSHQY